MSKQGKTVRVSKPGKPGKPWIIRTSKPGKIVRLSVSGLTAMFNDTGLYEVRIKREHGITRSYSVRADSVSISMLDELVNSGALSSFCSMFAYPLWTFNRSIEDLALEAMGAD